MMRNNGANGERCTRAKGTAMEQDLIGVFDSGVGGLTVVRSILRVLPASRLLYVADQAHVPYGGRPLDEVRQFALGISRFLAARGCGAVVMACNISSAVALEEARAALAPIPVLGVIHAAVERVAQEGISSIGVLATEGTVRSDAYRARIAEACPEAQVVQVPCPRFVPLVERGEYDGEEAEEAARAYLEPLASCGCRVVILGCTHYPFLIGVLRRVAAQLFQDPPEFVDPAEELTGELLRLGVRGAAGTPGRHTMLTTGDLASFQRQLDQFLPRLAVETGHAVWRGNDLAVSPEGAEPKAARSTG